MRRRAIIALSQLALSGALLVAIASVTNSRQEALTHNGKQFVGTFQGAVSPSLVADAGADATAGGQGFDNCTGNELSGEGPYRGKAQAPTTCLDGACKGLTEDEVPADAYISYPNGYGTQCGSFSMGPGKKNADGSWKEEPKCQHRADSGEDAGTVCKLPKCPEFSGTDRSTVTQTCRNAYYGEAAIAYCVCNCPDKSNIDTNGCYNTCISGEGKWGKGCLSKSVPNPNYDPSSDVSPTNKPSFSSGDPACCRAACIKDLCPQNDNPTTNKSSQSSQKSSSSKSNSSKGGNHPGGGGGNSTPGGGGGTSTPGGGTGDSSTGGGTSGGTSSDNSSNSSGKSSSSGCKKDSDCGKNGGGCQNKCSGGICIDLLMICMSSSSSRPSSSSSSSSKSSSESSSKSSSTSSSKSSSVSSSKSSSSKASCGDGNLDPGEQCERNILCPTGRYCDTKCMCLSYSSSSSRSSASSSSKASCGDGNLDLGEQCELGHPCTDSAYYCNTKCMCVSYSSSSSRPSSSSSSRSSSSSSRYSSSSSSLRSSSSSSRYSSSSRSSSSYHGTASSSSSTIDYCARYGLFCSSSSRASSAHYSSTYNSSTPTSSAHYSSSTPTSSVRYSSTSSSAARYSSTSSATYFTSSWSSRPGLFCGNGTIDHQMGEECDDGANNGSPNDPCTNNCKLINGHPCLIHNQCDSNLCKETTCSPCETSSECPGQLACTVGFCKPASCGNAIVEPQNGEQCDDGPLNGVPGARCSSLCQVLTSCGNGLIETLLGEECDDGMKNGLPGDPCSGACQLLPRCGNGVLDPGESCDDGNQKNGDGCSETCQLEPGVPSFCGDSIVEQGEVCDDGPANSDALPNHCRTNCILPFCGDGVLDLGEQCDLARQNGLLGSTCDTTCHLITTQPVALSSSPSSASSAPTTVQIPYVAGVTTSIVTTPLPPSNTKSGPEAVVLMAMGASAGWAWMKKRRK